MPADSKIKKILIADDEEMVLELLKDTLQRAFFDVITAKDGKEALDKIYSEHLDAVILDEHMPFITGNDVCREIRNSTDYKNLPIVILTVDETESNEIDAYNMHVDHYMKKPFRPSVLIAILESLIFMSEQRVNSSENKKKTSVFE